MQLRSIGLHQPRRSSSGRLSVHVATQTSWPIPALYQPMLGLVLRGTKRVTIGDRTLH
ncbi:AraC family transcriptional regulator (plasmid) [Qingshengfaniella alkalisoli]|uniref:AraC family transcriptional regulator n=1 Tax=Qingshengfaniella alkalisoli TaxID=2599296 RepID=A0A5B8J1D8_9RHOB|nr:AraC family transcriptional regulator [Qingshengfaniella alkalisoli]